MCLSGAEEHIPGCSFREGSFVEGWKRQERTFECSNPFFVCWRLFGPGTPVMVGSCGQRCGAARGCCPCEGGSRGQVLEGGGGLMTAVETIKTGQDRGNAAVQGGIPGPNSFSSCWGWDSPRQQEGGVVGAGMAEECAG